MTIKEQSESLEKIKTELGKLYQTTVENDDDNWKDALFKIEKGISMAELCLYDEGFESEDDFEYED